MLKVICMTQSMKITPVGVQKRTFQLDAQPASSQKASHDAMDYGLPNFRQASKVRFFLIGESARGRWTKAWLIFRDRSMSKSNP
jgi:hypothetical protein